MATLDEVTLFDILEIGVPPYSARGITETLEPIGGAAQMFRTVNGELVDLGATQFRKYRVTVTCTDMDSPALDGIWPGMTVTVDCITELVYRDDTDGTAGRSAVPGSERTGEKAAADGGGADGFSYFRPRLTCKVLSYQIGTGDGWKGNEGVSWTLTLEEV